MRPMDVINAIAESQWGRIAQAADHAHDERIRVAERERCAKLVEARLGNGSGFGDYPDDPELAAEVAALIRKAP